MASGNTLLTFYPYNNEPPAAAYATMDERNARPVLDFDDATDETAVFTGILPRHYAGGGLTVYLHLTATTDHDPAHASYWDVSIEACAGLDLDGDSFAAAQSAHVHCDDTSGIEAIAAITFTDGAQMDSLAAGGLFRLKVTRDANHVSDDWSGDAELLAVEIKET